MVDGQEIKQLLPYIPRGPALRDVMDEQERWITTHPGASKDPLIEHLGTVFSEYTKPPAGGKSKQKQAKANSNQQKKSQGEKA